MAKKKIVYNLEWEAHLSPLELEFSMIRIGGTFKREDGLVAGNGLLWHWKRAQQLLWPDIPDCLAPKKWHRWNEMQAQCYLKYRTIVVIGPASSGKTNAAATDALLDYYLYPSCTTIIICSTTKERLEDRIFGEIKKYHRAAKEYYPWLPGNLIEGRLRIVTDPRSECAEGRDFRSGVVGVPCQHGDNFVGLGSFCGIKNKRVRLIGDELSMLPKAFVEAISNLDKNEDFRCVGLGNPKDPLDALGILAEPSTELGGWESDIDQSPQTKTWPTRRPDGICLQLVGSDSPNLDGKMGIPLITQAQIDRDVAFYGQDSLQFTMMNQGRMPRGVGTRRVLTRPMCVKFGAMTEPIWRDSNIKKIAFMDAGYGGDRCIFGELEFGKCAEVQMFGEVATFGLSSQEAATYHDRQLLHLVDIINIPVSASKGADLPEDQIVNRVTRELQNRGIPLDDFFYEPGMRTKLTVAFARLTGKTGNPIDCMGKPTEREVAQGVDVKCCDFYSKFITELWYTVRLIVEASQFRGMREDALWEFSSREYTKVGKGLIEVETKEKMKTKTGRSPDIADAIAIGCEGARQRGFKIAKMTPPAIYHEAPKRDSLWKTNARIKASEAWRKGELDYAV